VLVLEEGYPFLERQLLGILPMSLEVRGRRSGHLPPDGELTPDLVREALGLPRRRRHDPPELALPSRPPQLCKGCSHSDTYAALKQALSGFESSLVTGDIGCYTLGALPPYKAIESCVCMGSSVGMAKGVAEAGRRPAVAVIGDSTFLHSGITPLIDAVVADTDMTLIIVDNEVVAMTGGQMTALPPNRIEQVVLGLGVPREHCHLVDLHPKRVDELADLLRKECEHRGLSVVIASRACIEAARRMKKQSGGAKS
jgi:indolepyruvate ferredoxin oxidoreductase alpha subunit